MTAIAACDVEDKDALARYREKRSAWLHMLVGDERHSISKQISEMLWNDAVFRTVNEARRLAREGGYASSARNWSIALFMDQGWVSTQTLAIRKLMEQAATKPERQVISLRRILTEITESRALITRENYVCHDGLPFDPEPGKAALEAHALGRGGKPRLAGLPTSGPYAWRTAEMCHEEFDRLSGVSADKRSRGDLIMPAVFEKMEADLTESGWRGVSDIANKFIAHAADEYSRGKLAEKEVGFTIGKIEACHRAICRTFAHIYGPILWQGAHGLFPIPQFNYFENLEAVWLSSEDVKALGAFWAEHTERAEGWSDLSPKEQDVFDELANEGMVEADWSEIAANAVAEPNAISVEIEPRPRRDGRHRR